MDAEEVRFRVVSASRTLANRARSALEAPRWRRSDFKKAIAPASAQDSPGLVAARAASNRGDWPSAHRALAAHFTNRRPRFPLDPRSLAALTARVQARFPDAGASATSRANRMLGGRYDVLGYRDVAFGTPPAWHLDPVHHREAPKRFWSTVPYLDPQYGDHKIIWEINRHQHWLALARAHQLTSDTRFYTAVTTELEDWLDNNPPLQGVNWASMLELGFRSLSWLWTLHFFAPFAANDKTNGSPWCVDLLVGLDRQLTHVEQNLSRYFSPNTHLTGEALALYVAGRALPELRRSERWASLGRSVLIEEIDRQILPDGGHVERSAHYHRYTTDFYLLALMTARLTGDPAALAFEGAARRLSNYLRTIADDRGRLPLLGDDDGGQLFPIAGRDPSDCRDTLAAAAVILDDPSLAIGEAPEEVYWMCGALLQEKPYQPSERVSAALPDTGYYVSRTRHGDVLVFDSGPHGFLNGGHAHSDALSIVLTVRGRPLLVDAGTGSYTADPGLRNRLRSTALHNTVVVNGRSQSKMRGPFHWSSVANARPAVWMSDRRFDYAEGSHDGYLPVIHARGVVAVHGFGWIVIDHLVGSGEAEADAFWHVHPDWQCSRSGRSIVCREPGGLAALAASSSHLELLGGPAADAVNSYAPMYGPIGRSGCLRARTEGPVPRSTLTFFMATSADADEPAAGVNIDSLPVTEPPPSTWHAAAFRITTATRQVIVLSAAEMEPASPPGGAPGLLWGCADAQTDGRLAVVDTGEIKNPPILVAGTRALTTSALASSVQRPGPTMLNCLLRG